MGVLPVGREWGRVLLGVREFEPPTSRTRTVRSLLPQVYNWIQLRYNLLPESGFQLFHGFPGILDGLMGFWFAEPKPPSKRPRSWSCRVVGELRGSYWGR